MDKLLFQLSEISYFIGFDVLLIVFCLAVAIYYRSQKHSQFYQLVKDSPLAMLIICERSGKMIAANQSAMQLLGVRKVGKTFVYPSSVSPESLVALLGQFGGMSFKNYRYNWVISDLSKVPLDLTGRKSTYKGNRVWIVYAVPHQKSDEEKIQEQTSLRISKTAMDSLSELIFVKDKDGQLIGTNRAFDSFWEGRSEEGAVTVKGPMRGRSNQRNWTTDSEGRSCLLETSHTMLISDDGDVIGSLGISHDVTDWYKMQQDLRDEMDRRKGTEAALAQRDIILQSILDSSPDAICIFNENRVYEACNQVFASALGIDDYRDLIGAKAEEILPEEVHSRFTRSDDLVIDEGKTLRYVDHMFDDNGEQWLDVVKSPYRDSATSQSGVLVMARDVTERYLAERKLEDMNEELEKLSFLDSLTTIANRRQFDEKLETFWNLHIRQKAPLTILLVDVDYFKNYNDNYGHQMGDKVLIEIASAFQRVLTRSTDCVARYGGEEFAFILPETDQAGAQVIADGIHAEVAKLNILHECSHISSQLTLSIGVASYIPEAGEQSSKIISRADKALYQAKESGRNRSCFYK